MSKQELSGTSQFGRWFAGVLIAWTFTWLLFWALFTDRSFPVVARGPFSTVWWITAKFAIWLAPTVLVARSVDGARPFARFGATTAGGLLAYGAPACAIWLGALWVQAQASGFPAPRYDLEGIANACVVSPVIEELLFRGFALRHLRARAISFWQANTLTSACFAALHLPGWIFMRGIDPAIARDLLSTAVFGFFLGAVGWRARSVWAPVSVHVANNLWFSGLHSWLMTP